MSSPDGAGGRELPEQGPRRPEQGLPDYHNPLAGIGGAAPARSPLTLRLVLASFGLVLSVAGAITLWHFGVPAFFIALLGLIAMTAVIDIVIVVRRKRRGEPG